LNRLRPRRRCRRRRSRGRRNDRRSGGRLGCPEGRLSGTGLFPEEEQPEEDQEGRQHKADTDHHEPGEFPGFSLPDGPGLFIEPRRGRFMLFKFKIGDVQIPVVFAYRFEGYVEVLMFPLGGRIQIDGVRGDLPRGGRRDHQLNGGFPSWPGLDILDHQAPDIESVRHGLGKTLIEIDLNATLVIVDRCEDEPFFY
jgi:hypothetical protein